MGKVDGRTAGFPGVAETVGSADAQMNAGC